MDVSASAKTGWRSAPGGLFAVLFCINALNYTDRYVLPAVASLIQPDLRLSDTQLGLLGTAFLLVYALAVLPAGTIADRSRRTRLLSGGIAFWSLATLLTGLTQSFGQILASRALLGIGESTYSPSSTTLIADSYPVERRARMMGWWGTGSLLGVFLGFAIGGVVGEQFGWRAAFFFTAVPGLIVAGVVRLLREPGRGATESFASDGRALAFGATMRYLLRIPSLRAQIVCQVLAYFIIGGVGFWVPYYLSQHFNQDVATAGVLAGGMIAVGGGIGTVIGGYSADGLLARGLAGARLFVPAIGFLVAAPLMLAAVLTGSLPLFLAMTFLAAGFLQSGNGPLLAMVQDVVLPARRGRAIAVTLLCAHLFGDALAPSAIGALADHLGSLQQALLVTPVALLLAGAVGMVGYRWVGKDRKLVVYHASSLAATPGPS
jgi:MFS family permease